ncbi:TetR/AcrR family transcriptional regulator [Streptacidiphilus sp. PB12-B1b]|uniref:TetR/AcrR family transcriptional regulator n=1 Tax=Streptacidiphilus sp. PB12-B1b TaxID=2705012 RepID=UPI0015FA3CD6|nr:TetR/AcrR family transcriptional regulator C-terminal domain-containing protein [Streptacidiphilus sp. PB12-B1b]QMU79490.1 TetR/AcrR family transcriptional regulator [Streptacidiphilus sp. PB12-B1b]
MTPPKPTPVSRRERPAKPALSREAIVTAAMEILRGEQLERVTMRRLAQVLDTGPASLYVYVRNTAELHAYLLDDLLAGLDLAPVTAAGDWRDRLVTVLLSYTTVLMEHPGLAQSALVTRPSGPGYLRLLDGVLALLDGQVPADRAAWAVDLLLHFATSTAAEQGARSRAADAEAEEDDLGEAITGATAETYPNIAALGLDLLSGTGEDRLLWGFTVLISGILVTPRPTG